MKAPRAFAYTAYAQGQLCIKHTIFFLKYDTYLSTGLKKQTNVDSIGKVYLPSGYIWVTSGLCWLDKKTEFRAGR